MFGRRAFFKDLAASPLAAKAVADKALGEAAGLTPLGSDGLQHYENPAPSLPSDPQELAKRRRSLSSYLNIFRSLPDWEVDKIKRDITVYALDPDIAALRSFSMSVKILMQKERNVNRRIEAAKGNPMYDQLREDFQKRNGFWFWW